MRSANNLAPLTPDEVAAFMEWSAKRLSMLDAVRDAAAEVCSSYFSRFHVEGRGLVGPIDADILLLRVRLHNLTRFDVPVPS